MPWPRPLAIDNLPRSGSTGIRFCPFEKLTSASRSSWPTGPPNRTLTPTCALGFPPRARPRARIYRNGRARARWTGGPSSREAGWRQRRHHGEELAGEAQTLSCAHSRARGGQLDALRAHEAERERAEAALLGREARARELEPGEERVPRAHEPRAAHAAQLDPRVLAGAQYGSGRAAHHPQKESVRQILKAGWHLLALINEVLDLARIESGKLQLSIESVGVEQIVREALTPIAPLAEKHQVKIVDETKAFRQLYVTADRTRLKQVLLNLLSNGVKYNKPGGHGDPHVCATERRADSSSR